MSEAKSLQETYAPQGICFGCGPANREGLRLRSFVAGEELVASFQPELKHQAFEGMLNGGIIGSLLDCHCNWMAAWHLMQRQQLLAPPCTVTAEYTIKMLKPTPIAEPLELRAWVIESSERRARIGGELKAEAEVTATCEGVFVAVKPGHPAYHRW
ncbi:MAG: PaaI family thioesterase [Planctomycetota bacterium]